MGLALVTGANGHVGNNLVRALIKEGVSVRAGIRNLKKQNCFGRFKLRDFSL